MLLLIDNYDSFTHNLARYFRELNVEVQVVRNDQITCAQIAQLAPKYLVFSPGPCTPNEAGVTLEAIQNFAGKIPILGVCLGHQAIGQVFGAKVEVAEHIMHGKTSSIRHKGTLLFDNIEDPFVATRYHSLILNTPSLPNAFRVTAWCEEFNNVEPMAIEHISWPLMGVQFHPESLLTLEGHKLLSNFVNIADKWWIDKSQGAF
ncbi:aminodeoxychorismate/anthranilate synthase component II [Aliiglaciecola sp. 3_MG-2023]|uniref:anthranilate synthase component II n=1 Tax=Aliiglaciecola sp. 3_MG-2023 TaxID=3062644 RepID=UPI0026E2D083|nr:aminodeoxychorismate/anthranilate synthase component II [Aliiglaciecola sp. 3_MG-2023]MDO6692061.1 aminodeoxychorismate/anthranilate synthase component II [Aliiglaciecola sp. 3_MG-2023]